MGHRRRFAASGGYSSASDSCLARLPISWIAPARILFAPHYNYISQDYLLSHFLHVRSDHIARATENGVWFVRGNNVVRGRDRSMTTDGVGYGDSYVLDPFGEMLVRARRMVEDFIEVDIDFDSPAYQRGLVDRSRRSARELGHLVVEAATQLE